MPIPSKTSSIPDRLFANQQQGQQAATAVISVSHTSRRYFHHVSESFGQLSYRLPFEFHTAPIVRDGALDHCLKLAMQALSPAANRYRKRIAQQHHSYAFGRSSLGGSPIDDGRDFVEFGLAAWDTGSRRRRRRKYC
jgi:hypothetical protein